MNFQEYKELVSRISSGKVLPDAIYIHASAINTIPEKLAISVITLADALKIPDENWNVLKFNKLDFKITYLNYPDFETYAYPALHHSFTVDVSKASVRKANYSTSENPPILHRKETFVSDSYPLKESFSKHTQAGEAIGLYENTRSIGFKKNWEKLIKKKGYFLDIEGALQPLTDKSESTAANFKGGVDRHLTAIDRNKLSQPTQILGRHNYFNGEYSFLDYGCGKGDDLRELEAHGIDASGWDPAHNPEGELVNSDIVNLGFVLNVIEDKEERSETLKCAYGYADKLLVVSIMVAGDSVISQFTPYKDGVITSRNTFQKYYSQGEFRHYIESTLKENAVPVGQGIFIVFKDKEEEQLFLLKRQHICRRWKQKTKREIKQRSPAIKKELFDKHIELFTDFWEICLDLGRIPANDEFDFSDRLRQVAGSHNKAHQALVKHFGEDLLNEAHQKRRDDLLVYFALGLFEKRQAQIKMPNSLKRDIKAFFSSYTAAIDEARKILFLVGDTTIIQKACELAHQQFRCGDMQEGHSYTFHKNLLFDAPKELRIYIGCATQLYGDLDDIQLIKVHITSGKVSLMGYKDWETETPLLVERIKIKMREQDIDFFDYIGRYEPIPLVNKSLFI